MGFYDIESRVLNRFVVLVVVVVDKVPPTETRAGSRKGLYLGPRKWCNCSVSITKLKQVYRLKRGGREEGRSRRDTGSNGSF